MKSETGGEEAGAAAPTSSTAIGGPRFLGVHPAREEARAAVGRCLSAGIKPVTITGDHPDTAKAIAQIMRPEQRVLIGADLAARATPN